MWQRLRPSGMGLRFLDAGNDDYWGRAYADCFGSPQPDVALSPFLHAPR